MPSILVGAVTGILATYVFLRALLQWTQDPKEPLLVDTTIPFIGPLIKMGRRGPTYWTGPQRRLPIYTLRLPGIRMYIVNSTTLIQPVQRHVRTISFSPILVRMAKTIMNVSKEAYEIISKDPIEDHGFVLGVPKANHPVLSPGPKLDALNRKSVEVIATSLDDFATKLSMSYGQVGMYEWISQLIMTATTEGIYGAQNPFRNPTVRKTWLTYEKGMILLMTGILPTIMASKYVKARESLVKAYKTYYVEQGYNDPQASAFIKERHTYYSGCGIPLEDIARIEVATSVALLSNTMPATFWMVFHIFSDSALLQTVREELSKQAMATSETDNTCFVDLGCVKNQCPILLATFKEVFRFHGMGVSSRWVLDDHLLDNQYLLKKGSILLIPAGVQHNLTSVWGDNIDEFDHTRFLQESDSKPRRYNPIAFRAFGGGSTLCPGRHFAATEILALAAIIVLRFDLRPRDGNWASPTCKNSNPATSIHQPDFDLDIEVSSRDDRKWEVRFSGSDRAMEVSAEDMVPSESAEPSS